MKIGDHVRVRETCETRPGALGVIHRSADYEYDWWVTLDSDTTLMYYENELELVLVSPSDRLALEAIHLLAIQALARGTDVSPSVITSITDPILRAEKEN